MALLINRSEALSRISENEVESMVVKQGNSVVYKSPSDGTDSATCLIELTRILDQSLPGQSILVEYSEISPKKRGQGVGPIRTLSFSVKTGPEISQSIQGIGNNGMNQNIQGLIEENAKLKYDLKEHQLSTEFDNKLKEMEERLSSKNGSIISQLGELLTSPIGQIALSKFFGVNPGMEQLPSSVAVAGMETAQPGDEEKKKIFVSINRLYKIDQNLHNTLTDLADFAEKSPDKFLSFIPLLKSL